ncbi:MAG: C-GCAxxG-C-C family protein [Clostridia bacterium]|jgi:C_GCAxxG_C_C family probable redox protein
MENQLNYKEQAMVYFKQGYNCAQSVLAAFMDKTGLDFQTSLKIASSFGGGMGRLREACGAVTGMFMAAGLIYGYDDPVNKTLKTEHYRLIQNLAAKFRDANGSIVCRDLLGLTNKIDSPVPDDRTEAYYKRRPCLELVGMAAEILALKIKEDEDIN